MPLGISEYLDALAERSDLLWPSPPDPIPMKATPSLQPLSDIRVVTWSVYGTLLRIDQGELLHLHPQELRVQIALEKTIKEFNMWNSMSRKPGQPWEYMLRQYKTAIGEAGMVGTKRKGDVPAIDSRKVWLKLLERLVKNEYAWEEGHFGSLDDLAAKVAYFYHANLQGTAASDDALETLKRLTQSGLRCGLLADAQIFTVPQLLHQLKRQGTLIGMNEVIAADCLFLSHQIGLRKPSKSLYLQAVKTFKDGGIAPQQVLHVSHRLADDLAIAKSCGFRTALLAADRNVCHVSGADLKNPDWRPDRLMTRVDQVLEILSV